MLRSIVLAIALLGLGSSALGHEVKINGNILTPDQLGEFTRTYGAAPQPGDYWYDTTSGLYGVRGHPAFGFMQAGHDFGKLDPQASGGATGVIVNGRHIPATELTTWAQLLGYRVAAGSYWLDGMGNTGYQGWPVPTDNLYLAAQRNLSRAMGGGGGAGGGNFWSSRFSAGNYDSGNTRGYVSVPGYGPVGYGF